MNYITLKWEWCQMVNYISEIVRALDIYGVMCVLGQHSGDDPGFLLMCCLARIVCINILATLKYHSHFSFQEIVMIHLGGPCLYQKCLTWYYRLYLLEGWQCVACFNELEFQLCWANECYRDPMRPLFCWTVYNGSI